ncbi:hypothetical protein [Armatimonas sp.]|uniref:hypothetical protein n=1 Tax=Armatimonas sp. TaxID=1872638 RepID=UPI00374D2795
MAGNVSVDRVVTDAALLINAWKSNPDFKLADIKREDIEDEIAAVNQDTAQIESLRSQLTLIIEQRDQKARALSQKNTRMRSGFRAFYGPDSPQYKQAGGTPTSERKSPKRRTPTTPPTL